PLVTRHRAHDRIAAGGGCARGGRPAAAVDATGRRSGGGVTDRRALVARYRDRIRREVLEQPAGPVDPRAALATRTRELLRGEALLITPAEVDRVVEAVLDDALGAGPRSEERRVGRGGRGVGAA